MLCVLRSIKWVKRWFYPLDTFCAPLWQIANRIKVFFSMFFFIVFILYLCLWVPFNLAGTFVKMPNLSFPSFHLPFDGMQFADDSSTRTCKFKCTIENCTSLKNHKSWHVAKLELDLENIVMYIHICSSICLAMHNHCRPWLYHTFSYAFPLHLMANYKLHTNTCVYLDTIHYLDTSSTIWSVNSY